MKVSKVLLCLIMVAVLFLVALLSYAITVKKLGGEPESSATEQTDVQPTTVDAVQATTDGEITREITTAATTDNVTTTVQESTVSESTTVTVASSNGVELLPKPTVITVNDDTWYLTLMNKWYKIDQSYTPKLAEAVEGSGVYLDYRVAEAYSAMYAAAAADGVELYPCSGYRSLDRQTRNYNDLVARYVGEGYSQAEAEAVAAQSIMVPGQSEHNYGFAMDIGWISNDFANSSAYAWLSAHAAEYGFIERYKKEKMSITGVYEEPWHWRYVGVDDANAINASGQCLEEYLGMVN